MAYAAVTSLKGTLYLHFLQSQPRLPLEDLEAQIREANNENIEIGNDDDGEAPIREIISEKQQLAESSLTSRITEVGEVKQKIVSLHENLGLLQEILEKSKNANDDSAMKDLEAEMRDVWFKAEESIEMELTTIYLAKGQTTDIRTACLLSLQEILNKAEKQTDYYRNELIRIKSEYQLAKVASSQNETVSLLGRIRRRGSSLLDVLLHKNITVSKFFKHSSKFDDSRMVGCHEVLKTILDQLTRQSTKGRQVVSVVGMGGIGKTTLAHKVYEDPSITSHFDKRAWVTVSQEHSKEQMLRCLMGGVIAASRDELHKHSADQLAERLRKHLKEHRYLIVMDDIWSTTAWDSLQRCFPDDNNGSRILLTSRLKEVAKYASLGNSIINMPFLDVGESWSLYCKVFGKTEFLLVFEQIGRDIVKKCKGLPLAITIVASLLSKTDEEEEKWKNVAKSVIGDSKDACSRILYLSYNQLPHHLKACFLYFEVFPEDYEIPVKKLVRMWAAEGFFRAMKHLNSVEVAMECLQDLVDRSLVIVSKQSYTGEMKRIRIHDLLRDLCLKEAERENLLNVIEDDPDRLFYEPNLLNARFRWISDTSEFVNNQIRLGDNRLYKSHSIHSCFAYSTIGFYFSYHLQGDFSLFKLLRVVDIECRFSPSKRLLDLIAYLVHLRYFALTYERGYCDGPLRVKLFEHWNMQSFIVRGNFVTLDSSEVFGIWKMPLLRDFCVEQILSLETSSVVYKNLENISWLDPKLCTKDLFTRIPNLKKLGIDGGNAKSLDCFYNFVHLGQLETLSIRRWRYLKHIPCSDILWATSFLPNLKKLKFFMTPLLPWSDIRLIGMLPNLEILKLIHACQGRKWEPYDKRVRSIEEVGN